MDSLKSEVTRAERTIALAEMFVAGPARYLEDTRREMKGLRAQIQRTRVAIERLAQRDDAIEMDAAELERRVGETRA